MALDGALMRILACPIDKGGLLYFDEEMLLYNPRLRRGYRVSGGIPVLLVGQATAASDAEHARLLKRARCGEAIGTGGQSAEQITVAAGDSHPAAS